MYLYVIKCQNFYKIGITNNDIEARMADFSTGNPFPLEVYRVYEYDGVEPLERAIHHKFADRRRHGEWFELENEDLEYLDRIFSLSAEEIQQEIFSIAEKWDYTAMYAGGWRMEKTGTGKYWQWRERRHNGKTIYGGSVASLPCSIEEMRIKYESERTIS